MAGSPMKSCRGRLGRFRLAGAALAAAALLAGCVDQAHEVQLYRDVLDAHRPKPAPLQAGETLTLERALALANADNEQLASQGETYLQALIAKNRAFAAFLPTVNFQPNFTVEQAPRGTAGPAAPGAPSTSAAAVAASQGGYVQRGQTLQRLEAPVVGNMNFSYRSVPLYQAAKLEIVQQRQLLLDAQATILLNVAQAYYQVLISARQQGVLEHSLALQAARISYLRGRVQAQLALPLDLAQALADEAGTRVQLNQSANDVRNGRRTLALLIGAPEVDGPLIESTLAERVPEPVADDLQRALAGRQDLLAAQAAVEEAHYAVKAAIAEYYPSASLNAAAYLYLQNYADASKWNGILAANLPIFSGGAIRADVRDAWSRLRQAALFESYLRREIGQGVQTAYDNYVTSGTELDDLQEEVRASDAAYRQAIQLERSGLALPLDVLTAQVTLLNAQLQYANASFSRTVLYLDLVRARGDLNPDAPARLPWAAAPAMAAGAPGAGY
jgi:outer membrane protein TolC